MIVVGGREKGSRLASSCDLLVSSASPVGLESLFEHFLPAEDDYTPTLVSSGMLNGPTTTSQKPLHGTLVNENH